MRFSSFRVFCVLALMFCLTGAAVSQAQDYFYVGADGGDFFDENNWNSVFDSTDSATSLFTALGDILLDSSSNAIGVSMIVDPASTLSNGVVEAAGEVDYGTDGSLTLRDGSNFTVSGTGNRLDFNFGSALTATNATVLVNDDITFGGVTNLIGGTFTSETDDVEFQDDLINVTNTVFTAGDSINFDQDLVLGTNAGSIVGATFNSANRLSLNFGDLGSTATLVDATVNLGVPDGGLAGGSEGDIDDGSGGDAGKVTLLGNSSLGAEDIRENAELVLGGNATASLGNGLPQDTISSDSFVTLISTGASLDILATVGADLRANVINGLGGKAVSYLQDPNSWNITNWNGIDPIANLQVVSIPVPEPSSLILGAAFGCCFVCRRTRVSQLSLRVE